MRGGFYLQALTLRNWAKGAVFVALGVLLPIAFHMVGAMGSVFLPMHIPVLMAGLLLGPTLGACVGVLTPICSTLLTGMPPMMPMLLIMLPELVAYGWVAGYLRRHGNVIVALVGAMVAGRLVAGAMVWVLANWVEIKWTPWVYLTVSAGKGIPGLIIQLLFIPVLVKRLEGWIHR